MENEVYLPFGSIEATLREFLFTRWGCRKISRVVGKSSNTLVIMAVLFIRMDLDYREVEGMRWFCLGSIN